MILSSCLESGSGNAVNESEIPSLKLDCLSGSTSRCSKSSLTSVTTKFIIFNGATCASFFSVTNSSERVFARETTQTSLCDSNGCNAGYAGNYTTFFDSTTDQIEIGTYNIAIFIDHTPGDGTTPSADSQSANPSTDVILCREDVSITQSSSVISLDDSHAL